MTTSHVAADDVVVAFYESARRAQDAGRDTSEVLRLLLTAPIADRSMTPTERIKRLLVAARAGCLFRDPAPGWYVDALLALARLLAAQAEQRDISPKVINPATPILRHVLACSRCQLLLAR